MTAVKFRKGGVCFLEIITVKGHKVQTDCNNNQYSDAGNEHGDRDNQKMGVRDEGEEKDQKRERVTERVSVSTQYGSK